MSLSDFLHFPTTFISNVLQFLLSSLLHTILGTDPRAQSAYPSLASIPSVIRRPCPYATHLKSKEDAYAFRKVEEHKYELPRVGDERSPCPALNTMANHGYIPRDGRNLTGTILTHALIDCYALSWPLAAFLAWGGVLLLGQVGTFSLRDLARHNRIEHDASLTHANTSPGEEYAPSHSDKLLYRRLIADARNGFFDAKDIARARVRREAERGTRVNYIQQKIARGEVALVLQIFGGEHFAVPAGVVESWWKEERMPVGWRPYRTTTLFGTFVSSSAISDAMEKIKREERKEEMVFNDNVNSDEEKVHAPPSSRQASESTVIDPEDIYTLATDKLNSPSDSTMSLSEPFPSSLAPVFSKLNVSDSTLLSSEDNISHDADNSDSTSLSSSLSSSCTL